MIFNAKKSSNCYCYKAIADIVTTYVVKQLAKEIRQGRCLRVERRHLLYSHSHDKFALAKLVEDSFHIFGSSREKLNFIGLIVKTVL